MIRAEDYSAFGRAAGNGHLEVLDKLIKLAPAEISEMISAGYYRAFRFAAGS